MSKYDSIKFLKRTKARLAHICDNCGGEISQGDIYFPESIGKVNAPGVRLKKFCKDCSDEYGEELLRK